MQWCKLRLIHVAYLLDIKFGREYEMWFVIDSCRRSLSRMYEITTTASGYVNIFIAHKAIKQLGSLPIYLLETESESSIFDMDENDKKP